MKKLVLITSFAEYHLLECLIPNIIETINPDKIIISEGKMPHGPENKGFSNNIGFDKKWTYNGLGVVGFDWAKTKSLEEKYKELVEVREMNYNSPSSATECYIQSITHDMFQLGDEIYCFESDSFLYEGDVYLINDATNSLKIGEGLAIKYVDFLETQFYTENINIAAPKYRRFVYKFDNLKNYQRKMGLGYLTQNYPDLKKVDSFFKRHYCWWRPDEYKQLRFDLIRRNDGYWKDFEAGLQIIREKSKTLKLLQHTIVDYAGYASKSEMFNKILIRPSRQDDGRWASFIDVSHPRHIMNHSNFVK